MRLALLCACLLLQGSVLDRDPASLPHAALERWQGFFEPGQLEARAAALAPEVRAALDQAQVRYRAADYPGALEALFRALEREPDVPPAWLLAGTTYFRLRRYQDAVTAYERFLGVAPDELWRTQGLAHAYYSLGRYEDARDHYERVLARLPESKEAVRGLALSELRLGDAPRALELLGRVLALDPEHAEALVWRSRVLLELERPEEALADAEHAVALAGWDPEAWYARLQALWELGRDEQAAAVEERWRALDAQAQAIRALEADLQLEPRRFDLLLALAPRYAAVGDVASLRATLARLARVRPPQVTEVELLRSALEWLREAGDEEGLARTARALEALEAPGSRPREAGEGGG